MIISYVVGIGCSAILSAVAAFALLYDNSDIKQKDTHSSLDWPDDNCCHYEGDF